jgi:hypothetical protein
MSPTPGEEPLLPPWVMSIAVRLGPLAVLFGLYFLFTRVLDIPSKIVTPTMAVLIIGAVAYFGGRLYKPFYADKKTGACTARGPEQRRACRHYFPGAKLGGGCGRQKDNGQCRVIR